MHDIGIQATSRKPRRISGIGAGQLYELTRAHSTPLTKVNYIHGSLRRNQTKESH